MQKFAKKTDWAEVARLTGEHLFYLGQSAAFVLLQGPGPELFARWATDNPAEAIAWFSKTRPELNRGIPDNDWERLLDTWNQHSPESSISWVEDQIVSGQEDKYLDIFRFLLDSSTVEESTIRAARLFPDQSERFKILRLAAHSETYEGHVSRDPFANQQNPMSQDPELVTKLIPQFRLSESQVIENKTIINGHHDANE